MSCKWVKIALLAGVFSGLCLGMHARAAATDIGGGNGVPATVSPVPETGAPAPAIVPPAPPVPIRIALLLPLRSETLSRAAEAVRSGFKAAYELEKENTEVTVVETGDTAQDTLAAYIEAAATYDIIVGPLSRTGATAVAQSGAVSKPTIALTPSDPPAEAEPALPQQMLVVGLSVEEEARQAATWAGAAVKGGKAFVLSTNAAWQRRAAKAFTEQWQRLGQESQWMELNSSSGYLTASGLTQLKTRIQNEKPALMFIALDAAQAKMLRAEIGNGTPLYGTSQLNPLAMVDWASSDPLPELNSVRLLDIPWQLQPEHTAVMAYLRPVTDVGQKRSADLERLYALGIDAYRIAREIALNHKEFVIDGVTGRLTVSFGKGPARFQRQEQPAMYQDGMVVPVASLQKKEPG